MSQKNSDLEHAAAKHKSFVDCDIDSTAYDLELLHMPLRYWAAHEFQNELVVEFGRTGYSQGSSLLELGCGTAFDARKILIKLPESGYIGIDESSPMLVAAARNLRQANLSDRTLLINGDITLLRKSDFVIKAWQGKKLPKIWAALSCMTLHHLNGEGKARALTLVHECLQTGGLFVWTDLFDAANSLASRLALAQELRDIEEFQRNFIAARAEGSRPHRGTFTAHHYVDEHRLSSLGTCISLLESIGFRDVEAGYRAGQIATIYAHKS